jgi:GT2 family glycosyltransferase
LTAERRRRDLAPMSCDVVIVNYNAGALLAEGVGTLLADPAATLRVFVVDNASTDESLAALRADPRLSVIRNPRNLGFAAACNIGARPGTGDAVLFLNPDCRAAPAAIDRLLEVLEGDGGVGMVGGLLLNPDGTEQAGARRNLPTLGTGFGRAIGLTGQNVPKAIADYSRHGDPLPDHPVEVEAISGALMLVRRAVLEAIGGWDEGYFLHVEDLDFCRRVRDAGYRILFVPDARVTHVKGASSARRIFVEWHKHRGMLRFYRKFLASEQPAVVSAAVTAGVWLRFGALAVLLAARRLAGRA